MNKQEFPKWKYHQSGRSCVVHTPVDEHALGPGWVDGPFRDDGPTVEEYVKAGYAIEGYPPDGFLAKQSPAWTQLEIQRTLQSAPATAPIEPVAPPPLDNQPPSIPAPGGGTEIASVLDGTVAAVTQVVGSVMSLDTLAQMHASEMAGKNRKGVLDAVDARLNELAAVATTK